MIITNDNVSMKQAIGRANRCDVSMKQAIGRATRLSKTVNVEFIDLLNSADHLNALKNIDPSKILKS